MAAALLPALRDELAVLPGPAAHDGAPTWTLHDPLTNRFFRLTWSAFEILSRWHLGAARAVVADIRRHTLLEVDEEDVQGLAAFLARSQLLKPQGSRDVDRLLASHDAAKTSWLTWLLHHYLFFRLPLVRPDAVLERTVPWVRWLGSSRFRRATLLALLAGLFLVARQWDAFAATLVDQVSLPGLAAFGIALGLVKMVHELGHAFTAKHFGCRVPAMGVAFLVLWPMLYTDVNEAWKLTDRRQRLWVGGAGIVSELMVAAWATLAWGLLPDGTLKSLAFTLAATTWVSSLAINLSPFMRFDGYFLAMDALDQPNLHPRSFALARWHLREVLFGLNEAPPEPLPNATRLWMTVFAWAVWVYRLALFLGIALLVYHFFIKVVGVVLFVVEIGWFVLRPIAGELAEWQKRWPAIRAARRWRWPLAGGLIVLALLAAPVSGRVAAPAVLKAQSHVGLYPPQPALLDKIAVVEGQQVEAGAIVATLSNPDTALRLTQIDNRVAILKYELSAMGFDDEFRARSKAVAEELETTLAAQAALRAELERLTLRAPQSGTVIDVSPGLQPGQWINPQEAVAGLRQGATIEAYVDEADLAGLKAGDSAQFIPEGSGKAIAATIDVIDRVAVKTLSEPILATQYGGGIEARFDHKGLVPDHAVFRVRLRPQPEITVLAPLRGQANLQGERRSFLGRTFRAAAAILLREWGA
ncbi:MAG: HlyD family efflux transporter periplasmic adaptor subunit [Magnetospirillum sp.]|nr:HlyD family efflux transporter periplasmic adaptor subunit [Magnetospirillum sp.]